MWQFHTMSILWKCDNIKNSNSLQIYDIFRYLLLYMKPSKWFVCRVNVKLFFSSSSMTSMLNYVCCSWFVERLGSFYKSSTCLWTSMSFRAHIIMVACGLVSLKPQWWPAFWVFHMLFFFCEFILLHSDLVYGQYIIESYSICFW